MPLEKEKKRLEVKEEKTDQPTYPATIRQVKSNTIVLTKLIPNPPALVLSMKTK
jgi:hypothetical protein